MKRAKAKKRAPRRRTQPPAPPLITGAVLRRGAVVFAWVAVLAGTAYGLHRLEPFARAQAAGEPCRLEWAQLPTWLADPTQRRLLDEIEATAGLPPDADIHDPRICEYVGRRLLASPWVAKVERVSRQPDGVVRVSATFRKPLTMVVSNGLAHLVDQHGVRLPAYERESYLDPNDWIVINGVKAGLPELGELWRGDDLQDGLKLVRFLYRAEAAGQLPFRGSLRAVDVANWRGRLDQRAGSLRIMTIHPRAYIHWGLPPGEEYDVEATAERKLQALRTLYASSGALPKDRPIDVRDKDCVDLWDFE